LTKLFVLIFILLSIPIATAKGIDREFQLPEIVFDDLITLAASDDNALFEKSFKRLFTPEDPYVFSCGITSRSYTPQPQFKYTFSLQKSVESWTPLFDNYKVTSYWLVTL